MSGFVIREWTLEPYDGDQAPPHIHHSGEEAFICIEGDLEVVVGEAVERVEPGHFALVARGQRHTFRSRRGSRVIAVMSPEIATLIDGLHQDMTDEERKTLWERCNSTLVPST